MSKQWEYEFYVQQWGGTRILANLLWENELEWCLETNHPDPDMRIIKPLKSCYPNGLMRYEPRLIHR